MPDLTDFMIEKEDMSYHARLNREGKYLKALLQTDQDYILEIEKYVAHNFRYYQKEALAAFNLLYNVQRDKYPFKEELYEKRLANGKIPFYGFEMATGSGKTLLIGALIIYLNKYENYNHFIIITPSTEIYKKTINNFNVMSKKCIFSQSLDFKFNVITGENFTDKSSNYNKSADLNVYIFNIQKFFERTTGVLRIDKEWEQSYWKDNLGNTISFRSYLKEKKLVIITDEAHHYQNIQIKGKAQTSGQIIISLEPNLVLEFTATAVTEEQAKDRRSQKIIYKYSINKYISDGYGKKVRAFGYTSAEEKSRGPEVTEDDKKKFLVSYMIHLIKKEALKENNFKPILLIRARNIKHAETLNRWIKDKITGETELIDNIYNEIIGGEKFVITSLIRRYISLNYFKERILELPKICFTYHSDNENLKDVIEKIDAIEINNEEVLIQIRKLEEGWDIQNPYTMLILSISKGKKKNYIKQLIGRGVRLFREKRIHDGLTGFLRNQQEILHVICEKGGNFEEFVKIVREELGLSKTTFQAELFIEQKTNKSIAKFDKYNELQLPVLEIYRKISINAQELVEEINYKNLKMDLFLDKNVFTEQGDTFWKIDVGIGGEEKDLTGKTVLKIKGSKEYESKILNFKNSEIKDLISSIISSQSLLPSHPSVKHKLFNVFNELNRLINTKDIKYLKIIHQSRKNYVIKLKNKIVNHISNVLDNYFNIETKIRKKPLKTLFPDEQISIEKTSDKGIILNVKKKDYVNPVKEDFLHLQITGFIKSYYEYNWFESSHEFKFAYQLDNIEAVEFWIRNKRSYYFEYGIGNKYYPDFIVKIGSSIYIIEVKGTYYLRYAKTLKEVEMLKFLRMKGYNTLFLLDKKIDKKLFRKAKSFDDIISCDYL